MLADRVRISMRGEKIELPEGYVMAKDSDFTGSVNGLFIYTGTDKYIIIPDVIKGFSVTSYNEMFDSVNGKLVEGVISYNSNVNDMTYMFFGSRATSLDLSSFDTSNVTNMSGMFRNSQATSLDLTSFDTSNVTNMAFMFRDSRASSLDLSSFDTSKVTNMANMFYGTQVTTAYARTQADADKFNAAAGLGRFIVKP